MRLWLGIGLLVLVIAFLIPQLIPFLSSFVDIFSSTESSSTDELDDQPPTLQALHALKKVVDQYPTNYSTVAVGYNANLDLIVKALDLLEALKISPEQTAAQNLNKITSKKDLKSVFIYHFSQGTAVERFIDNEDLCQEIMSVAATLPRNFLLFFFPHDLVERTNPIQQKSKQKKESEPFNSCFSRFFCIYICCSVYACWIQQW
jgi:hypothetical protein